LRRTRLNQQAEGAERGDLLVAMIETTARFTSKRSHIRRLTTTRDRLPEISSFFITFPLTNGQPDADPVCTMFAYNIY